MTDLPNISGREDFIIARALQMALLLAPLLPDRCRSVSDERDMRHLLDEKFAQFVFDPSPSIAEYVEAQLMEGPPK